MQNSTVILLVYLMIIKLITPYKIQEDLELKAVYVIFRHGSRYPLNSNHTDIFYGKSQNAADLTQKGVEESFKNGQTTFNQYFNKLFNFDNFDINHMVIQQSSNTTRTIDSLKYHVKGFLQEYHQNIRNSEESLQLKIHTNNTEHTHNIYIQNQYLSPPFTQCPFIKQTIHNNRKSKQMKKLEDFFKQNRTNINLVTKIQQFYGINHTNITLLNYFFDLYDSLRASGLDYKLNLTEEEQLYLKYINAAHDHISYFGNSEINPYISTRIVQEIYQFFLLHQKQTTSKLFLVSSHDITLQGLLTNLNLSLINTNLNSYSLYSNSQPYQQLMFFPDFAATLKFELHYGINTQAQYVQLLYNDINTTHLLCSHSPCTIEQFLSILNHIISSAPNYEEVCHPYNNNKTKITVNQQNKFQIVN